MKKSLYETNVMPQLDKISELYKQGEKIKHICSFLNISYSTLNKYKKVHPELYRAFDLLCDGRRAGGDDDPVKAAEPSDNRHCDLTHRMLINAEAAMYKLAVGYKYTDETVEYKQSRETGEFEICSKKIVTKEVAPNYNALRDWLSKEYPDKWKPGDSGCDNGFIVTHYVPRPDEDIYDEQQDDI